MEQRRIVWAVGDQTDQCEDDQEKEENSGDFFTHG
jgi:hypothetical protein